MDRPGDMLSIIASRLSSPHVKSLGNRHLRSNAHPGLFGQQNEGPEAVDYMDGSAQQRHRLPHSAGSGCRESGLSGNSMKVENCGDLIIVPFRLFGFLELEARNWKTCDVEVHLVFQLVGEQLIICMNRRHIDSKKVLPILDQIPTGDFKLPNKIREKSIETFLFVGTGNSD